MLTVGAEGMALTVTVVPRAQTLHPLRVTQAATHVSAVRLGVVYDAEPSPTGVQLDAAGDVYHWIDAPGEYPDIVTVVVPPLHTDTAVGENVPTVGCGLTLTVTETHDETALHGAGSS